MARGIADAVPVAIREVSGKVFSGFMRVRGGIPALLGRAFGIGIFFYFLKASVKEWFGDFFGGRQLHRDKVRDDPGRSERPADEAGLSALARLLLSNVGYQNPAFSV